MLSMKQPTFATSSWWRTGTSAKFAMSSGALRHVPPTLVMHAADRIGGRGGGRWLWCWAVLSPHQPLEAERGEEVPPQLGPDLARAVAAAHPDAHEERQQRHWMEQNHLQP